VYQGHAYGIDRLYNRSLARNSFFISAESVDFISLYMSIDIQEPYRIPTRSATLINTSTLLRKLQRARETNAAALARKFAQMTVSWSIVMRVSSRDVVMIVQMSFDDTTSRCI
jgi:hypothetical protein